MQPPTQPPYNVLPRSVSSSESGRHWHEAKKILICCHDAGGAEIVSEWVRAEPSKEYCFLLQGPAVKIFRNKIAELKVLEAEEAYAELPAIDFVLAGTSWGSSIEIECIARAREREVFSAVFLDHWINYPERFIRDGAQQLPDEIWVGDEDACQLAGHHFKTSVIRLLPNPYFLDLKHRIEALDLTAARSTKNERNVLFVCENISDHARLHHGDDRHWGYTEFDALEYFFENLSRLGAEIGTIHIRPHPSDESGKYDHVIARHSGLAHLSTGRPLIEEIAAADLVVGCESMALVVGLLAGKRVITCIPPGGLDCRLPQKNILHLRDVGPEVERQQFRVDPGEKI